MAEWSIAAVLKTVEGQTSGGSNPSLSAETKTKDFTKAFKNSIKAPYINKLRCFFYTGTPTRRRLVCRVWQSKFWVSRNYLNPEYRNNINPSVARKEASATKSDGCQYQLSFIGATPASVVPVTNNVRVSSILLVDERHTLADSLLIERNQFMMALRQRLLQAFYHTFQCNHRAHLQERAEHNHIVRF